MARPGTTRPQNHTFAYTGLIRCGACGLIVTAEHKRKLSGRRYVYYHCSKSRLGARCPEPYVEVSMLERQIKAFLRSLDVHPDIDAWVIDAVARDAASAKEAKELQRASLARAVEAVAAELRELTGLRLRTLLTDEEFIAERRRLQQEELRLTEKLAGGQNGRDPFEPVRDLIMFSKQAVDWFERGDDDAKRRIVKTAYSNPTLKAKILSVEAAKPFITGPISGDCSRLRRRRDSNSRYLSICHLSKVVE